MDPSLRPLALSAVNVQNAGSVHLIYVIRLLAAGNEHRQQLRQQWCKPHSSVSRTESSSDRVKHADGLMGAGNCDPHRELYATCNFFSR
jgi:hypothetical protein